MNKIILLFILVLFFISSSIVSAINPEYSGTKYYPVASCDQSGVTSASITSVVNGIGTTKRATVRLIHDSGITTIYYFSSGITLPKNILLDIEPGAMIASRTGTTIIFYSPENIKVGNRQQIFTGAGGVSWTRQGTVYPEWWGAGSILVGSRGEGVNYATSGDTTYDSINAIAFQKAINSCYNPISGYSMGTVHINSGCYRLNAPIYIRNTLASGIPTDGIRGLTFEGEGIGNTFLKNITNGASSHCLNIGSVNELSYYLNIHDFHVYGSETESIAAINGSGVSITHCIQSHFYNIMTEGTDGDGIYVGTSWQNVFDNLRAKHAGDIHSGSTIYAGLHLNGNVGVSFDHCMTDTSNVNVLLDSGTGAILNNCDFNQNAGNKNGLIVHGGSNLTMNSCYFEGCDTIVGVVGEDAVTNMEFNSCSWGGDGGLRLVNVNRYTTDGCYFSYPYNTVLISGTTVSGRDGSIYNQYNYNAPLYTSYSDTAPELTTGSNLLRNGSFEYADAYNDPIGWTLDAVSGTYTRDYEGIIDSDHSGDKGTHCLKMSLSAYTSGSLFASIFSREYMKPFVAGKIYTMEFSYKITGAAQLQVVLNQSGNPSTTNAYFSSTDGQWKREKFTFKNLNNYPPNVLFYVTQVGTVYIDSVMIYEGTTQIPYSDKGSTSRGLETYSVKHVRSSDEYRLYSAQTLINGYSGFTSQPDIPRNITVGATGTLTSGITFTVCGVDAMGSSVTEALYIPSGSGATYVYGNIAFAKITQVDNSTGVTVDAGLGKTIDIGVSSKIGLPMPSASIIKLLREQTFVDGGSGVSGFADDSTYSYSRDYNTITLNSIVSGEAIMVYYIKEEN